jgi:uncharacterized membrane protein
MSEFNMGSDFSDYEELVKTKIRETGEKGISQQELARAVGIPVRDVAVIVKKLIERKIVAKKAIKENGKNVIKLFPLKSFDVALYVELKAVNQIPCMTCNILSKCGDGTHISPSTCNKLSFWILDGVGGAS